MMEGPPKKEPGACDHRAKPKTRSSYSRPIRESTPASLFTVLFRFPLPRPVIWKLEAFRARLDTKAQNRRARR